MKKKLLLALSLIAIMTVLFAITISAATPLETWDISKTSSDSVTATLYSDYSLVISGTGNMKNWSNTSSIPWASYRSDITSLTIEEGVTSIGTGAFYNFYSITSIDLPDSITSISKYAFYYCLGITSIVIPDGVTSIKDYTFFGCHALESVVIPNSVTSIGSCAFKECYNLESINIPNGVATIGSSAFDQCSRLANIVIPNGVTSIESCTFYDCYSLASITLPDSVKTIGNGAFSGCYNLSSIVIPKNITSIDYYAFDYCYKLVEVYNLSSLNITKGSKSNGSVGYYALNVYTPNSGECKTFTTDDGFVFYDNGTNRYLVGYLGTKTDIVLPKDCNGYTYKIYKYAFYSLKRLTSVKISTGVISIGSYAFGDCSGITNIEFEYGVTSIGSQAFHSCENLTSIALPNSVTSIGSTSFAFCKNLKKVFIPKSVTAISSTAFYSTSLISFYCEASSQPSSWETDWDDYGYIYWNHTHTYKNRVCVCGVSGENAYLESIFTFKGYSFGFAGQIAVGYDIDYVAIALYEAKTGKTLEIGVVFAGYDNLGGKQPLDENGQAITLSVGRVSKADLTSFNYPYYDFVLTDIDDSIKDVKLVIAAYIFDSESVKYVQASGISDTVSGISYNEAKESVEE